MCSLGEKLSLGSLFTHPRGDVPWIFACTRWGFTGEGWAAGSHFRENR